MIGPMLAVAVAAAALATAAPAQVASPAPATTKPVPVVVVPAAPTPVSVDDKYKTQLVCRTSIQTGSLIAKHKVCLTRRQWSYVNDQTHDDAQRLVDDTRGKSNSN